MLEKIDSNNLAIVILSSDKYADVWPFFFHWFFKLWPNPSYKVYLFSNSILSTDARVETILSGDDFDWSTSFKVNLAKIPETNLVLLLEDFFLNSKVDEDSLKILWEYFKQNHLAYLRLIPIPEPKGNTVTSSSLFIGDILPFEKYRTAVQCAIWDKDVLTQLLKAGENPWQFEQNSPLRSKSISKRFCSLTKANSIIPIPYLCTAIIKGKWAKEAIPFLSIEPEKPKLQRPIESNFDFWRRTSKIWRLLCMPYNYLHWKVIQK